ESLGGHFLSAAMYAKCSVRSCSTRGFLMIRRLLIFSFAARRVSVLCGESSANPSESSPSMGRCQALRGVWHQLGHALARGAALPLQIHLRCCSRLRKSALPPTL